MDRDGASGAGQGGARRTSAWALLSLVAGVCFMCPAASLLAPVLGAAALLELKRNPLRSGRRLAFAGIILGVLGAAWWAAAAGWWQVNARLPMLEGPARLLRLGLGGDVEAFRAGFTGPEPGTAEAAAFLSETAGRYGGFIRSQQREPSAGAGAAGTGWASGRARIPYTFLFEAGPVEAEAEFVVTAGGARPLLKFAWFALRDDERGDLVYPASAAAGRTDVP